MSKQNTYEPFIGLAEAAAYLDISSRALRDKRYNNTSPPYCTLAKNVVRYRMSEVVAWAESKREES